MPDMHSATQAEVVERMNSRAARTETGAPAATRMNLYRRFAVACSDWLDALRRRCYAKAMRLKHDECFRAAERIYRIGFKNPPECQIHLSEAKDELYRAAAAFEAEAEKASNDKITRGDETALNQNQK